VPRKHGPSTTPPPVNPAQCPVNDRRIVRLSRARSYLTLYRQPMDNSTFGHFPRRIRNLSPDKTRERPKIPSTKSQQRRSTSHPNLPRHSAAPEASTAKSRETSALHIPNFGPGIPASVADKQSARQTYSNPRKTFYVRLDNLSFDTDSSPDDRAPDGGRPSLTCRGVPPRAPSSTQRGSCYAGDSGRPARARASRGLAPVDEGLSVDTLSKRRATKRLW